MSQENVDAWRRAVDAYNRRDTERAVEIFDPDVEWRPTFQRLLGGDTAVYRGRHGVREFLQDLDETFVEIRIEISEIRDLGDRIVAIGHIRMRGRESGAEVESPIAYVAQYRNGKVIRLDDYLDHQQALEAAGLSE